MLHAPREPVACGKPRFCSAPSRPTQYPAMLLESHDARLSAVCACVGAAHSPTVAVWLVPFHTQHPTHGDGRITAALGTWLCIISECRCWCWCRWSWAHAHPRATCTYSPQHLV